MVGIVFRYGIIFSIPACIITVSVLLLIRRNKKVPLIDVIWRCTFVAYCCFLLSAVFVGRPHIQGAMLVPFSSYYEAWATHSLIGWRNILLNIAMFIPFGVLFPVSWNKRIRPKHFVLIVCCVTLSIEIVQYVSNMGIFEIDDLINNLIGSFIGFAFWKLVLEKARQ